MKNIKKEKLVVSTEKAKTNYPVMKEPQVDLVAKIEALEKKDKENQSKLSMLEAVADKGRIFNYENKGEKKKSMIVKLSVHEGNILVGWRTLKDVLVKNPTTGLTVGEEQEYELLFLDKNDKIEKMTINGYSRFSDIRYSNRIDVKVTGRKEDENGNFTFTVLLKDGREIDLESRFIN